MPAIRVQHNDVEVALRLLKRQLRQSGLLRELRRIRSAGVIAHAPGWEKHHGRRDHV